MVGMFGIIAALTVLGLSLVITRIATTALSLTGLSWEASRFQARSAFTGTGFTTEESEHIVKHPVRRQIITWLMIARSAGLISIVISLILSFGSSGEDDAVRLIRLGWLIAGVGVLWVLASSKVLERWMRRVIKQALNRWTDLDVRDYNELLKLSGDYTVREVRVDRDDWLADRTLADCRLREEGVLALGIYRTNGAYLGAPEPSTRIYSGDTLLLYGRSHVLRNLDERRAGPIGEAEHARARTEQQQEEAEQERREEAYERERESEHATGADNPAPPA